jgi:hypothetical protein
VSPQEDDACRAIAEEIQQARPGWMVIWGVFSRRYTAYPLFPVRCRAIVVAYYPAALLERMDSAERLLRIRRSQGEGRTEDDRNDL